MKSNSTKFSAKSKPECIAVFPPSEVLKMNLHATVKMQKKRMYTPVACTHRLFSYPGVFIPADSIRMCLNVTSPLVRVSVSFLA